MLDTSQVPLSESAPLVVDVQDSFKVGPRWNRRSNPKFEVNMTELVDAYRNAALPILYFLHSDPDPGFEASSPNYKLMNFLCPRPEEPVFHKTTRNCVTSTPLAPYLMERGIRRIAITGIQMDRCCEITARVGADLGYAVDFIIDGMLTFPIPNVDDLGRRWEWKNQRAHNVCAAS
jgi:nicotinamidase-related amidase